MGFHQNRIVSVMTMSSQENIVREILNKIGIKIGGPDPWDIQVKDDRMYAWTLRDKNLGLGESYMEGWWECPRIDQFIYRVLTAGVDGQVAGGRKLLICTSRLCCSIVRHEPFLVKLPNNITISIMNSL